MKKTLSLVLATVMVLALNVVPAAAVNDTEITVEQRCAVGDVYVDTIRLDTKQNDNIGHFWVDSADRTQAPVRLLVENMGYDITYKNNVITIPGGPSGDVVITIGSDELLVGGSVVKMDTTAVTINNRTYVPLRFVAEALSATVETGDYGNKNGFSIKILNPLRPDRTMNGLDGKPFTYCKNVQTFIQANKELFTSSDGDRLTMEYIGSCQLKLDIFGTGDSYIIENLDFDSTADKQYELVFALIDDVVEETSRQAIKDKLNERRDTLNKGYDPIKGITADALAWKKKNNDVVFKIGNVNFIWTNSTKQFKISTAV